MSRYSMMIVIFAAVLSLTTIFAKAGENTDVRSAMNSNFNALMNLQTYIADPKAFSDPKNRDEIQKNIDALATNVQHAFPQKMAESEPGLAAIATLFSDYLQEVQRAFKGGANGAYVRNQLRTMTGLCLSCHTRVGTEQSFADVQHRVDSLSLTDFQRAEFYAATRQFDKAIKEFDKIISNTPPGEFGYIEFGRAVRESLSVTIRVKQDPKATLKILEKLAKRTDAPEFFQRYVTAWKRDAEQWLKEKKSPKNMSVDELMAKAQKLIESAAKDQLFAVDPAGDIHYLRATNYLHEALQRDPKGKFRGDALYYLGVCYDALQDPMLWALDSLYFEACVREFSHTPISKKCYRRYATKLYFGYTGSGGTFVPEDEIKKLNELRKLSE